MFQNQTYNTQNYYNNNQNQTQNQYPNQYQNNQQFSQRPTYSKPQIVGVDPLQWVNKENSVYCSLCETHFNFTTRKHNCRVCGNVFCGNCTKNRLPLQNSKEPERSCFLCFTQHTTLLPDEQRIVDEACTESNEFPQMRTLVFRKKDGKQKRQHAIIVVTRYRIIRLKRNSSRILWSYSLLELSKLTMSKKTQVILEFGKQTGNIVNEQFETSKALELVLTIRIQHAQVCLGMPSHCQLLVISPDEWLLPVPPPPQIGVAGGFCDTYRAWCNFYSTKPSEELIQYITDGSERTPYIFDLTQCPGIEPSSNVAFDLHPVFAALRYNNYFLAVLYADVVAKGAMELLANCLRYNRTITKLQLANLTTSHLSNIGHALSENRSNVISEFDFSGTQISEKAIKAISLSIIAKEYGIRELKFSNCSLTAKGVGVLLREGLLANLDVSSMIEVFDLSNNRLDEEGSILLQLWLSKISGRPSLRTFNISKAGALLNVIIPPLEHLPIENLDLSNNILDYETCQMLSNILINSRTLQSLNVSNCSLTPNSASLLLTSIASNTTLAQVKLNFSNNNLSDNNNEPNSTISIASAISRPFPHLHTLNLSSTKLSEKVILQMIESLTNHASGLHTLILDDLFGAVSGHIPGARLAHLIADMTLLSPSLRSLSLGENSASFFGSGPENIILPFLQRMHRNQSILHMNLSGNRMGDKLAVAVAEMLRYNTTLVHLVLDDNRTTLTGFQSIEYALHRNRTLQKFENPLADIKRCISSLSNAEKEKKLFSVLSNIQLAVYFNRQTNGIHSAVEEPPILIPRSGPLLVFDGQNLPGESPAFMQTPIPGVEYSNDSWNSTSQYNNNAQYQNYNTYDVNQNNYDNNNNNDWSNNNANYNQNNNSFSSYNNNNNNSSNSLYQSNNSSYQSTPSQQDWSQPEWATQSNSESASSSTWPTPSHENNNVSENRNSDLIQALASVLGDM